MKMKLNRPAMLAALSCLGLAGYAGAASLSQVTPDSVDVVVTYPALPLKLEFTKNQERWRPNWYFIGTEFARFKLEAPTGVTARLGIRWAAIPEQTHPDRMDLRIVTVSGTYNPANKLEVRYVTDNNNASMVSINGGADKYVTSIDRVNSMTGSIGTSLTAMQYINADRYVLVMEGAVYRP